MAEPNPSHEVEYSSTSQLATIIFQLTSFTGLPQILRSKGAVKWFKITFFILCFLGFLYQASEFVDIYLRFPVVLVVEKQFPDKLLAPALTICSGHSFRKSRYCKKYPDHCEDGDVKPQFRYADYNATHEEYQTVGVTWKEAHIFDSIQWETRSFIEPKKVLSIPMYDERRHKQMCYVVNHQLDGPNKSAVLIPKTLLTPLSPLRNNIALVLFHDLREKLRPTYPDMQVSIHSPFEVHNPFFEGYTMVAGDIPCYFYDLVETRLLPWPYATDCRDYIGEWEAKGHSPLSRRNCIQQCIAGRTLKECHCFPFGVLVPSETEFCTEADDACVSQVDITTCYSSCKPDCTIFSFGGSLSTRPVELSLSVFARVLNLAGNVDPSSFENITHLSEMQALSTNPRTNELVIYKYIPKYQIVETFMYVGGYLGMWLGISVFEMLDFLELFALFCSLMRRRP